MRVSTQTLYISTHINTMKTTKKYINPSSFMVTEMANRSPKSLRQHPRVWLLQPFHDDYKSEKYSDPKENYVSLREEWKYRLTK